jgi:hypothetical protein
MNFPLPVFDEEMELPDDEFQQFLFMLIHDCKMTKEEFKVWWLMSGREN